MPITVLDVNPNRGWRSWHISQIFTGPMGTGNVVPNVNDMVVDYQNGLYRVQDVDLTTNLSTLIVWTIPNQGNGVIQEDTLLGSGPGGQSESFRCLINTSAVPMTLAIDSRLHIYSRHSEYIRVFKGTNIGNSGIVISAMVDQNGVPIDDKLPLEVVQNAGVNTLAIKAAAVGTSVETVEDGEVVTAVVYSASGVVLSVSKLLVVRTDFIRSVDAARKYITSIELISPFIAAEDSKLLKYPVNMLIQSGSLKGRVNYNDGSSIDLPIDGNKFKLMGIENYAATQVGQRAPLLLTYTLSNNEYGLDVNGVMTERFMEESYDVMTTEVVGGYSVKLFAVPVWQSVELGYKIDYYLYNLDRDEVFNVTPYVTLSAPNNSFNPFPTGSTQTLTARINLNALGSGYAYYIHTQTFQIALLAAGNSSSPKWWIQYSPGGDQIGGAQAAVFESVGPNEYTLDISAGKVSQESWVEAMYEAAEPLIHPTSEVNPPAPTHVRLKLGSVLNRQIPIGDWDVLQTAVMLTPPNPYRGDALRLEFIRITESQTLELAVGVMPVEIPD